MFQPLYIYGPHTAKDCEQWFIDRIIRCGCGLGWRACVLVVVVGCPVVRMGEEGAVGRSSWA